MASTEAPSCAEIGVMAISQGEQDAGMRCLLNPEVVILDVKEESVDQENLDVKEESEMKEELLKDENPSSEEEKICVEDQGGAALTLFPFDHKELAKEEEILVKPEFCDCSGSCDCVKPEPYDRSDDVENMEPLMITHNQAELPELNKLKKPKTSFRKENKHYRCDACDYKCVQFAHMEYHIRTHTGEKPLACQHCDYRASHPTTLKRHLRQHTGEKPYSCKFCDYKTAHPAAIARHMKTHTGEKPYACDWCDFKTADRYTIKVHTSVHTGERPLLNKHQCQLCGFATRRSRGLKRHYVRDHPEASPPSFRNRLTLKTTDSFQNIKSVGSRNKSTVRSKNSVGEWSSGGESVSSDSDVDPNCYIDVKSDANVDVSDWVLPDASSSGRKIKTPKRLDL